MTHFRCSLWALIVLSFSRLALSQSGPSAAHDVPRYLLQVTDARPISTPPFSFSSAQCDSTGNVYLELPDRLYSLKAILRVSSDGKTVTPIPLPTDLGSNGEWHYYVSQDSSLFVTYSEASKNVMIRYSPSGIELGRTNLELPTYFHIHSFAVHDRGDGLFFGSTSSSSADLSGVPQSTSSVPAQKDTPYTIWLDQSGRLVKKITQGERFLRSDFQADGLTIPTSPMRYVMATTSKVSELSSFGETTRSFNLVPSIKGSTLSGIQYHNGEIALVVARPQGSPIASSDSDASTEPYFGPMVHDWLVVNLVTGEEAAWYQSPKDIVGTALCYLGDRHFLYFTVKDSQPTLVEAGP